MSWVCKRDVRRGHRTLLWLTRETTLLCRTERTTTTTTTREKRRTATAGTGAGEDSLKSSQECKVVIITEEESEMIPVVC